MVRTHMRCTSVFVFPAYGMPLIITLHILIEKKTNKCYTQHSHGQIAVASCMKLALVFLAYLELEPCKLC